MRGLIVFTFFISLLSSSISWAQMSCSDLKTELLNIEADLMHTKLPKCSESITENCCNEKYPETCLTLDEATDKYNEAVANLIIYEGFAALMNSVQNNSYALKNISEKKIKDVNNLASEFLDSFERAKFLQASLNIGNNDLSLYNNYEGKTPEDMHKHIQNFCNTHSEEKQFLKFCGDFKEIPADKMLNVLTTLQGFSEANKKAAPGDEYRRANYDEYQDYLNIKVEGKVISLSDDKSYDLKQAVERIKTLSADENIVNDEEKKKELLALTKEVPRIKATLNKNSNTGSDAVTEALNDDIQSTLESHLSMSFTLLGTEQSKIQIENMLSQLRLHSSKKNASLSKDFSKIRKGDFLSHLCESELSDIDCLKKAKNEKTGDPEKFKALDLGKYENKYAETESSQEKLLEALSLCYEKPSIQDVYQCQKTKLLENKKDLNNLNLSIQNARDAVSKAQKDIDRLYGSDPLRFLQLNKMHAYKMYQDQGCETISINNQIPESYCKSKQLQGLVFENSLIGNDMSSILFHIERNTFDELLKTYYGNSSVEAYKKYREDTLEGCADNDKNREAYCHHLSYQIGEEKREYNQKIEEQKKRIEAEKNQKIQVIRQKEILKEQKREDRNTKFSYAMQGLAQVAAVGGPQIMMTHLETQNVKAMTENYRQNIIYQQKYNDFLASQRQYYGDMYSMNPYMNYGWGFYNPNLAGSFNYPNNSYTFYQHGNQQNFSQFNFLPSSFADVTSPVSPVGNLGGNSSGTGTDAGTTTGGNFGFNF